jgi:hypothetical protein
MAFSDVYPENLEVVRDIQIKILHEGGILPKDVNPEDNFTEEQMKNINEVIKTRYVDLNTAPIRFYCFVGVIRLFDKAKVIIDNDLWEKCLKYLEIYEKTDLSLWSSIEQIKGAINEVKIEILNKIKPKECQEVTIVSIDFEKR